MIFYADKYYVDKCYEENVEAGHKKNSPSRVLSNFEGKTVAPK